MHHGAGDGSRDRPCRPRAARHVTGSVPRVSERRSIRPLTPRTVRGHSLLFRALREHRWRALHPPGEPDQRGRPTDPETEESASRSPGGLGRSSSGFTDPDLTCPPDPSRGSEQEENFGVSFLPAAPPRRVLMARVLTSSGNVVLYIRYCACHFQFRTVIECGHWFYAGSWCAVYH